MSIQSEIEKRVAAEMAAQAVPMSRSDQVIITQAEPDAPGVYISSEQQQQDLYNRQLLQQQAMGAQMSQQLPRSVEQVDTTMGNPNFRHIEEPRMTADEAGNIIIY